MCHIKATTKGQSGCFGAVTFISVDTITFTLSLYITVILQRLSALVVLITQPLRGSVQENQAVDESSLSHLFKISMKIDSWKPSYYNCHPYCFLEICIPLKNETAWVYGRPHLKDSTETRVPTPLSNRTSTATSNSQLESARTLKCMLHGIILVLKRCLWTLCNPYPAGVQQNFLLRWKLMACKCIISVLFHN